MVIVQAKDSDDLDQGFVSQGGETLTRHWIYLENGAVSGFYVDWKKGKSQRWFEARMTGEDNRMSKKVGNIFK